MGTTVNGNIHEVMKNYEKLGLLHEMFVKQALETPDKVNVRCGQTIKIRCLLI